MLWIDKFKHQVRLLVLRLLSLRHVTFLVVTLSALAEQLWQAAELNKAATRWLSAFRFPHLAIKTSAIVAAHV